MIGLVHNYSRTNPGDGLLTDLTMKRLGKTGLGADDVVLVALDPDSFPEFRHRVRFGARGRGLAPELVPAAGRAAALTASAFAAPRIGRVARQLSSCEAIVGVGGGYLRAADAVSSIGALLNHLPQLAFTGRARVPSLYLPQTIGPLRGPVGRALARAVRGVDAVCVRDPWSESDLGGLPNVRRVPDLAVLNVADRWDEIEPADSGQRVGIVAGQVPHASGYEARLIDAVARIGERSAWVVHKTGHRTKSDTALFEQLGIEAGGELTPMLAERGLSVVISVRLHGALMSLAAGVPAIHLAYDRKGPGAFGDLGLDECCLDIRSLDPVALSAVVAELLRDPGPYWDRVAERIPSLRTASAELDSLVGATLG